MEILSIMSRLQDVLLFWVWMLWIVSALMTIINVVMCLDEMYIYKDTSNWIKDNSIKVATNVLTLLGAIGTTTVYLFLY